LGSGSRATEADVVSVGGGNGTTSPVTRRITNVSAATLPTDAATYGQLTSVSTSVAGALGGGAAFDPATGLFTGPTYSLANAGGSYTNVGSALTALDTYVGTINSKGSKYFQAKSTGVASSATGTDSVAVGAGTVASGTSSLAEGKGAKASATNSLAEGTTATASGTGSIALGTTSAASKTNAIALGTSSVASGTNAVAVGGTASGFATIASATGASAFGGGAGAEAAGATSLGYLSEADSADATAVGTVSYAHGTESVAVGYLSATGRTVRQRWVRNRKPTACSRPHLAAVPMPKANCPWPWVAVRWPQPMVR
jgi:autotransporter adhesin